MNHFMSFIVSVELAAYLDSMIDEGERGGQLSYEGFPEGNARGCFRTGCESESPSRERVVVKSRMDRRWKLQTGVGFTNERRGFEREQRVAGGEGRENDVRAQTKRSRCRQTGADRGRGPKKEFELVRFSPWPLTIAIVSTGARR